MSLTADREHANSSRSYRLFSSSQGVAQRHEQLIKRSAVPLFSYIPIRLLLIQ